MVAALEHRFAQRCDPLGELAEVFSEFEILRVHERVDAAVPGGPPCALAGIVARKPV